MQPIITFPPQVLPITNIEKMKAREVTLATRRWGSWATASANLIANNTSKGDQK